MPKNYSTLQGLELSKQITGDVLVLLRLVGQIEDRGVGMTTSKCGVVHFSFRSVYVSMQKRFLKPGMLI